MTTEKDNSSFSVRRRLESFKYAFNGIRLLFREHNPRIHLVATILAVTLGVFLKISTSEWITITLLIGLVFSAEAGNSAVERLADKISLEHHPLLGEAKDLAAGAVLFCAIASAVVGVIIFLPKIYKVLF